MDVSVCIQTVPTSCSRGDSTPRKVLPLGIIPRLGMILSLEMVLPLGMVLPLEMVLPPGMILDDTTTLPDNALSKEFTGGKARGVLDVELYFTE